MEYGRIRDYLLSLERDDDMLLSEMRDYAELNNVPIVKSETESLIRTLTALKQPDRILEVGTAIGYSTIVMAKAAFGDELKTGRMAGNRGIITIESYEKRIPEARRNISLSGFSGVTELIFGNADDVLPELCGREKAQKEAGEKGEEGGFDLVFIDAAKGQYLKWLEMIKPALNDGALIICDNVMQDFTVMESSFSVERRDRTIHKRMREFLYEIKHDESLVTSVIPIGDGVSISVFKSI